MTTCSISWCDRPAVTQGLCGRCAARKRLGIDPNLPPQRTVTKAERERLKDRIIEMRQEGRILREIADEIGANPSAVGRWLKAWGEFEQPTEIPHGSPAGWQYHKCRCDICRAAKSAYKREERRRRFERPITAEHGTLTAYSQGCTCELCTLAMRLPLRARQDRTRAQATRYGAPWTGPDAEIAYRDDLTIEQRAERLGRTYAAVDNFIRTYNRRPDDPYGVKRP